MYLAHGPISYLANEAIQGKKIKRLKMHEQILVAISSLFFGILPDFDILMLSMFGAPRFIHHDFITHSPIFYISIWLILRVSLSFLTKIFNEKTDKVLNKKLLNILVDTFLIATIFHLFGDFITDSIMFLYPITNYRFYILKFVFERNIFASLVFSTFFAIEIFLITIFLFVIYKKFIKQNKRVILILKSLIITSVVYLSFTMYMSLNTYNSTYMYDEKGELNYDIDYDGVPDWADIDVGNTGENNIEKARSREVLNSATNIIDSNKWTTNHDNSLVTKVKYLYGGFNSYRVVAQTYYDMNLPIVPVLQDYHIKTSEFQSYLYQDYDYPNLLFEYLKEEGQLTRLDTTEVPKLARGRIFFVMEEVNGDGNNSYEANGCGTNIQEEDRLVKEMLNLGITLEGNNLATVLDTEENLTSHSYKDLLDYYSNYVVGIYLQK